MRPPSSSSSVGPRTVQCARLCAGENLELALSVVCGCVVQQHQRCMSTLYLQTLFFPVSLRRRPPFPFSGLSAIWSMHPFIKFAWLCVRCDPGAYLRLFFTTRCALLAIASGITPIAELLEKRTCAHQPTRTLLGWPVGPCSTPEWARHPRRMGGCGLGTHLIPMVWSLVGSPVSGRLAKLRGLRSVCWPGETFLATFLVSLSSFTRREKRFSRSRCSPEITP